MKTVYLGLFSKVFNWVFDKILSPVVNFIGDLLGTAIGWVYETVLIPVLTRVLSVVVESIMSTLKLWYAKTLYEVFCALLKAIDITADGFDVFIGITDVTYKTAQGADTQGPLLEALLSNPAISGAVWGITGVGLTLALIFTIFATMKSTIDLDFENKRPIGTVLKSFLKTMIQFLCVPVIMAVLIKLSGLILKAINMLISGGVPRSLGGTIFYTVTMDASKINLFGLATVGNLLFSETEHKKFLTGEMSYLNIGDITKSGFTIYQIDYLLGFICGLTILIMLISSIIVFIKRLFEVILLYIVSPLFVSATPLDDGERFGRWREMFIGKLIVGYGTVIALRLYLIIVPEIIGNSTIKLTDASGGSDSLLRAFLLIGGCWAIKKVGPMLTSLISAQAGMSETDDMRIGGQMISAHVVAPMRNMAQGALREVSKPMQAKFDKKMNNLFSGKRNSSSSMKKIQPSTKKNQPSGSKESYQSLKKRINLSLDDPKKESYSALKKRVDLSLDNSTSKGGTSGTSQTHVSGVGQTHTSGTSQTYSSGASQTHTSGTSQSYVSRVSQERSLEAGQMHSGVSQTHSSGTSGTSQGYTQSSSTHVSSQGSGSSSFGTPTLHSSVPTQSTHTSESSTSGSQRSGSNITVSTHGMKKDK